jgi:hypothetical protein
MSAINPPSPTEAAANANSVDLDDRDRKILAATREYSLSTVAIAEQVGLGRDPTLVLPILERLERLALLDGFFAAGRVMTSANETHRRYYRLTDRGRQIL